MQSLDEKTLLPPQESPARPKHWPWLTGVVRVGSGLLGLVVLMVMLAALWQTRDELFEVLRGANLGWLSVALALSLVSSLGYVAIWHFAARSFGASEPYWATLTVISLSSAGRYLPGGIWSLLGLVGLGERIGLRGLAMPVVLTVAQGVHLLVAWCLAVNGLAVLINRPELWQVLAVLAGSSGLVGGLVAGYRRYLERPIQRLPMFKAGTRLSGGAVGQAALSSLAVWVLNGLRMVTMLVALQPEVFVARPLYLLVYLTWAAALGGIAVSLFFFVPLGLGAVELSLATLLGLVIGDWPTILAILLLNRVLQVFNDLIFALYALAQLKPKS